MGSTIGQVLGGAIGVAILVAVALLILLGTLVITTFDPVDALDLVLLASGPVAVVVAPCRP